MAARGSAGGAVMIPEARSGTLPTCRFCSAPLHVTVVDLGMAPLSNAYVSADQLAMMEPFYPLHARVCARCFLVQLEQFETPDRIFGEYAYFSSYSDSWLQHARRFTDMIVGRLGLGAGSRVVEIASNDGYLLRNFVEQGIPALGIEPAANVAAAAEKVGVPTLVAFFGSALARELVAEEGDADLVIGNNVLAHVPDLNDFVAGLRVLVKPSGVVTLEFPHLFRLLAGRQFDTIYHEHFSYFSLATVQRVFDAHGLEIFDLEELPTHGGSLRIYARPAGGSEPPSEAVLGVRTEEEAFGISRIETYQAFGEQVREAKRDLLTFLIEAKRAGKQTVGYGAAAKGNTLLNYCGIRTDFLDYVVDRNPHKQGRFLPGSRIPIFPPERIFETRPDYILILPWNLREEIVRQMDGVGTWGCRFVVPIPSVGVIG